MNHVFQKRLLRSVVGIALMVSLGAAAQAQGFSGGQATASSFQAQGRQGGQSRLNDAPRVADTATPRQSDQDSRAARRSGGDRRGSGDWNRDGRRAGSAQDATPQGDRSSPRHNGRYEGRRDAYRDGYRDGYGDRGGYGRQGWARGGHNGYGRGRYDGDRYPGYGRHAGAYGPRFPAYRGWGWAHGGYAAPVIIAPAYRGWAYNYPYAAPLVVVPAYRGWAVGPAYPVSRRR